jgi:hypothetical protein
MKLLLLFMISLATGVSSFAFVGTSCRMPNLSSCTMTARTRGISSQLRFRLPSRHKLHMTESLPDTPEPPQQGAFPPWLLPFLVPALGGALFGWDIGSSSSVVRIIGQGTSEFGNLDAFQLGLLASTSLFGAMGASAAIIAIGDRFIGRKTELLLAAGIYGAGSLLESLAPTFGIELAGRALYGIGIGTAMHVAPLYIAESVPSSLRGTLVSLKEAAIVLGIVAGYGVGAAFGAAGGWREVSAYRSRLPRYPSSFCSAELLMLAMPGVRRGAACGGAHAGGRARGPGVGPLARPPRKVTAAPPRPRPAPHPARPAPAPPRTRPAPHPPRPRAPPRPAPHPPRPAPHRIRSRHLPATRSVAPRRTLRSDRT